MLIYKRAWHATVATIFTRVQPCVTAVTQNEQGL